MTTLIVTLLDAATEVTENAANVITEAQRHMLSQETLIYLIILMAFGLSTLINSRLMSKGTYEYKEMGSLFKIGCIVSLFMSILIFVNYLTTILCINAGKVTNYEKVCEALRTFNIIFAIFVSFTAIPYIRFLFNRLVKLIAKSKLNKKDTDKKVKQTKSKSSKKFTIVDI